MRYFVVGLGSALGGSIVFWFVGTPYSAAVHYFAGAIGALGACYAVDTVLDA